MGKCSSVGHDVRFERVVMVRGLKSCDIFFGSFGTLGLYSSEGEITPKKVGTIVYYISWMLNISFYRLILDAYYVISMFLCGVMVRLWVVGFECDFGVVVRVRFITSFDVSNRLKMANR